MADDMTATLEDELHKACMHPDYEYWVVNHGWMQTIPGTPPAGDGWIQIPIVSHLAYGTNGSIHRYELAPEKHLSYWRRKRT